MMMRDIPTTLFFTGMCNRNKAALCYIYPAYSLSVTKGIRRTTQQHFNRIPASCNGWHSISPLISPAIFHGWLLNVVYSSKYLLQKTELFEGIRQRNTVIYWILFLVNWFGAAGHSKQLWGWYLVFIEKKSFSIPLCIDSKKLSK